MSMIRPFLFFGSLLLLVMGNWYCTSGAGKPAAQQTAPESAKDSTENPKDSTENLKDSLFKDGTVYRNVGKEQKGVRLEDGSDILMSANTTVLLSKDYNKQNRECMVNGEVFFHVADRAGKPFIVYTRNLQIFVLGTKFRVNAFSDNAGEEVDLLEGRLRVRKSYHSTTDNDPEVLEVGEMVMINRDIDLMEKEKLDSAELKKLNGGN